MNVEGNGEFAISEKYMDKKRTLMKETTRNGKMKREERLEREKKLMNKRE